MLKSIRLVFKPKVFVSFDWPNSWRANQIKYHGTGMNQRDPKFVDFSLKERSKAKSDAYIKSKIRNGIDKANTVLIANSPTYDGRKYTEYEMRYAIEQQKRMLLINTHKMRDQGGRRGIKANRPKLCKEYNLPSVTYTPRKTNMKELLKKAKKPVKNKK